MLYPEAANWKYQVVDCRDDKVIDTFEGPKAFLDARELADSQRYWIVVIA